MTTSADQITPEIVQGWFDKNEADYVSLILTDKKLSMRQLAQAYLQQATELEQLRAERAGLLEMLSSQIQCYNLAIEKQPEKKEILKARQSVYKLLWNHLYQLGKSHLTRAQTRTDGEG